MILNISLFVFNILVIDSIEANVETATIHVQDGAQQIARAREYHVSKIVYSF